MKIWLMLICHFYAAILFAQQDDSISARFVLIGDAGALVGSRSPVIDAAKRLVPLDQRTTVLFLGDNLYRHGLPSDEAFYYDRYRSVLDSQVSLVRNTAAQAYFIPGNHDWDNGGSGGYGYILRQQRYIDAVSGTNVRFAPKKGCPGPVAIDITSDVVVVIMDSQWWLHLHEKPGIDSDCEQKTKDEVLVELEDILSKNQNKLILFSCHHPFRSTGVHSGYYTWKQHIFPFTDLNRYLWIPLPLLGSIYPISRSVFGTPQDLKHPGYNDLIRSVTAVLRTHGNVILASGHEHNLQYFVDSNLHYVVSGSGCKEQRVAQSKTARFLAPRLGFALLEVSRSKAVYLSFYTVNEDSCALSFRELVLNFARPLVGHDSVPRTEILHEYRDSVLAPASTVYRHATGIKRIFQGENYRNVWSTPVWLRELNLRKEQGGLTILRRGGGKQTKSLTLIDGNGRKWSLRTIDKDPALAVPLNFRSSIARDVVQDMISAAHPYAPLVVADLAKTVHVVQARPQFFLAPDDPAFGRYRSLFANRVVMLESRHPLTASVDEKSSLEVFNKQTDDNDHLVDQHAVLRSRLLDFLIGDWDRHMNQWRWAVLDTGIGKLYVPIPEDRDQAFFNSDGLLLKVVSRGRMPFLSGFRYDLKNVDWLGYSARHFDRLFLNGLSQNHWDTTVRAFQQRLTDSAIDHAVRQLPKEVYPIGGDTLAAKLKRRRDLLYAAAMKYFRFTSRSVTILGSNKQEYFHGVSTDSGVMVRVYVKDSFAGTGMNIYERLFDPKITREIRLYGFNGNDRFALEGSSRIRFRIIGGKGADTLKSDGRMRSYFYDLSSEPNVILGRSHNRQSDDPNVNSFNPTEFEYDIRRFPNVNFGFNSEDGLMLGIGFVWRTYGFRRYPYAAENRLATLYSPFNAAYNIRYRGIVNQFYRNYDIVISGDYYNPTLNNFFGLGNETERDHSIDNFFYRTRYKYISGDLQIRRRLFAGLLGVSIGPTFFYYWNRFKDNQNRILRDPQQLGFSYSSVYGRKTYAGVKLNIHVNNLNSDFYPTRGIEWNNEFIHLNGLNNNSSPLTRFHSDMSVFASIAEYDNLLAVLRLGGGHIFSDQFEYFQALNLGASNYLRGFRRNRFSGRSLAYGSLELRVKLADIHSSVMPGDFGVIAFNDVGRVWITSESSRRWHYAYGGGLYFLPYNLIIVSTTAGLSEEGLIFNFSFGTKLNLYF